MIAIHAGSRRLETRLDAFIKYSIKFSFLLAGKADTFEYRDPCHVPGRRLTLHTYL